MKPRLTPARLTPEDMEISVRVSMWAGFVDCFALSDVGTACDRRDAELMLAWQRIRLLSRQPMAVPSAEWLRDPSEPRWQPVGGQL